MQIINESQPEFLQKIGCYLEQSAPNPQNISIEEITNLLPLSLRELAWMIAICEAKYSLRIIPWELPTLKDRVAVLHNVFLKQITDDFHACCF